MHSNSISTSGDEVRKVTFQLVIAVCSAALGMFQLGYNTGVINTPQKVLGEFIANVYKSRTNQWISEELSDIIWSVTVSVFAIGGMFGAIFGGLFANWCGRKTCLVLNNIIAVLGITLMSSSHLLNSIECLIFGRLFVGFSCGVNTTLVPIYLCEISTVNTRGAVVTASQLAVALGLLFSQLFGLKETLGTTDGWPLLFGFSFIPAVLQLVMLPMCPESPRYILINCGRVSQAQASLKRLRNSSDVEEEIEEIKAEKLIHDKNDESKKKVSFKSEIKQIFEDESLRRPLIISIIIQGSQQLSGINIILCYSMDIFLSVDVPNTYAEHTTIGIGIIMVGTTIVSMLIVDKVGRQSLHRWGLAGMFLTSIFVTISLLVKWMQYISVISILACTICYAIGPGSIASLMATELFTQGPRPAAVAISMFFNWAINFIVGLLYPFLRKSLQAYIFLPFTTCLAIFWFLTRNRMPETKNRTFEEIASIFRPFDPSSMPNIGYAGCTQFGSDACIDHQSTTAMNQVGVSQTNFTNQTNSTINNNSYSPPTNTSQLHQHSTTLVDYKINPMYRHTNVSQAYLDSQNQLKMRQSHPNTKNDILNSDTTTTSIRGQHSSQNSTLQSNIGFSTNLNPPTAPTCLGLSPATASTNKHPSGCQTLNWHNNNNNNDYGHKVNTLSNKHKNESSATPVCISTTSFMDLATGRAMLNRSINPIYLQGKKYQNNNNNGYDDDDDNDDDDDDGDDEEVIDDDLDDNDNDNDDDDDDDDDDPFIIRLPNEIPAAPKTNYIRQTYHQQPLQVGSDNDDTVIEQIACFNKSKSVLKKPLNDISSFRASFTSLEGFRKTCSNHEEYAAKNL